MKIIQVTNWYRFDCGEDTVFNVTTALLKRRGKHVLQFTRNSRDIEPGLTGRLRAFSQGIYSRSSAHDVAQLIEREHPDVVHVHNLYPLISPSLLVTCRRLNVPVVMTCHNYRLMCPTAFHLNNGAVCERCVGGREYSCILKNCRGNIFESVAYALRNIVARKLRLFKDNVTFFIAPTEFIKARLVDAGFRDQQIVYLPYPVPILDSGFEAAEGQYIGYAGRISPEKGIDTLLAAAERLPQVPVRIAGDGPIRGQLSEKAPKNARFLGLLDRSQMSNFYRKARFLIVPSVWFEVSPMVILEAMSRGLPVIASRIGGLAELVEDGVTGFLFEPGNVEDLAKKMKRLWDNPDLCRQIGIGGREKAMRKYSEDIYYKHLMVVYERAIELSVQP
jgi:glycosyltransferase involved in cell wall biosynthesis